jgi:hypothetical protein
VSRGVDYLAGYVYGIAREAYERVVAEESETKLIHNDALVAVVFSAASLEGFINELPETVTPVEGDPPSVSRCCTMLREAEKGNASAQFKYLLASGILHGRSLDQGAQPYQDFALLFKLRAALLHVKPQLLEVDEATLGLSYPKNDEKAHMKRQLMARQALTENLAILPFPAWASTRGVAHWACNVAVRMVRAMVDGMPDCPYRTTVATAYLNDVGFRKVG